jgi:tryptophanase
LIGDEGRIPTAIVLSKVIMDVLELRKTIEKLGKERINSIRMEATTNLIGGQPFSMQNLKEVRKIANEYGIMMVMDCSLISENAFFIKTREPGFEDKTNQRNYS